MTSSRRKTPKEAAAAAATQVIQAICPYKVKQTAPWFDPALRIFYVTVTHALCCDSRLRCRWKRDRIARARGRFQRSVIGTRPRPRRKFLTPIFPLDRSLALGLKRRNGLPRVRISSNSGLSPERELLKARALFFFLLPLLRSPPHSRTLLNLAILAFS